MKTAYQFFYEHAGYSELPDETAEQGHARSAQLLADAEAKARDAGTSFEWMIDPDSDSSEWTDEEPAYAQWVCIARDGDGDVFASLHGIDFGRDGTPWGSPYRRVVEAELACELTTD